MLGALGTFCVALFGLARAPNFSSPFLRDGARIERGRIQVLHDSGCRREWSRYICTCLGPVKSAILPENVQLYQIAHANVKRITTRHYPLWEVFINANYMFLILKCESKITWLFSNPCSFRWASRISILQNCCFCEFCTSQSPDGFWSRIAFIKRKTKRQTGFCVS